MKLNGVKSIPMDMNAAKFKSQSTQAILVLFTGPLGLFYSNTTLAILITLLALLLLGAFLFSALFVWPLALVAGWMSVNKHNEMVKKYIELRKRKEALGNE